MTSRRASGCTGRSAAIAAETRSASASSVTRMSTWTRAWAGTTLSAVPAWATVGVTVVPTSGRPSPSIASTWCDASIERVDALLRLEPGVRRRARGRSTSKSPVPLRPILIAPPSAAGSRTSTAPHARARSSISARDAARPDLLVGRHEQLDARPIPERGDGVDGEHDAPLHVEHARPGDAPVDAR